MAEEAKFTRGSLMRHVSVQSFTSSVGLMAIFAVDFIDMIFISMLGNDALAAAVGYAGTILFLTTSISIGLSIAAGALVARAIGAGEDEEARHYASSVITAGILVGIATVMVMFAMMSPILTFLGAAGETKELATSYLTIILPSMPILMAAMVGGAVLRAHGDATRAMYATLAGGITNAVLDPIFIFGLGLGLDGAAIASVFARFAILGFSIYPAVKVYNGFAPLRLSMLPRDARAVGQIAGPAILANVATPVGSALITREMAKFGTDAVAGMAIVGRLTPIAFAVVFALSGSVGPIIGQNLGAGMNARVRGTYYAALQFTAYYIVAVALILFVLRGVIADIFDAEGETLTLIYLFCGPLALLGYFNGVIFVGNATFNNLGHPIYSTYVNWGRHTLGTWPLAVAGGWMMGAGGVLVGQAVGGVIFGAISIWLALRVMKPDLTKTHDSFQHQARLHAVSSRRH